MATKEFVNIFNFLYSFIEPGAMVAALPAAKFEDEAVKLMKGLGYPGNLSKSTFVSIGSQHAWPAVLGCITFLCDLARLLTVSST